MRVNQFIARASGLSRRASDQAISGGRVTVNGQLASLGQQITSADIIKLDGKRLVREERLIIMLNKPVGYICSRNGQGGKTIYDLLPEKYHDLKPVGRLDKDSSGLILLTNDGQLAQKLTHPKFAKQKVYQITLDKPLARGNKTKIEQGITVENYTSQLTLAGAGKTWQVTMSEGKNRQIRRTFAALGYDIKTLHRTKFGPYRLGALEPGKFQAT